MVYRGRLRGHEINGKRKKLKLINHKCCLFVVVFFGAITVISINNEPRETLTGDMLLWPLPRH